jgi:hypothetical protein
MLNTSDNMLMWAVTIPIVSITTGMYLTGRR